jgi:hypothetical protein
MTMKDGGQASRIVMLGVIDSEKELKREKASYQEAARA